MNLMEQNIKYLSSFAEIIESPEPEMSRYWATKSRGDYVTLEGMEDKNIVTTLADLNITDHISSIWEAGKPVNIGYSPFVKKWYGWSHRAIFGFTIGSTCKIGNCQYKAAGPHDFADVMERFWFDPEFHDAISSEFVQKDGIDGVEITRQYNGDVPNPDLRHTNKSIFTPFPEQWGRGAWTAETMAEAREMAIDFAQNVS